MAALIDAPVLGAYPDPKVLRLSGLERMNLIHEGRSPRPPTHYWCGHVPTDWSPGHSTFTLPASPWFLITRGLVSPGIVALPADAALGTAFATTLPSGTLTTTSELSINFLRPFGIGRLTARASLVDGTPHQGFIESGVYDAAGRMVAHLTTRYVTLRPEIDPAQLAGDIPLAQDPPEASGLYLTPLPETEIADPYDDGGLDGIRLAAEGKRPAPPICRLLDLTTTEVAEGRFAGTLPASPWFTSPARNIYGGITALVLEMASTAATATTVPAGASCAPLDLKVQYLRPWLADGRPCSVVSDVIHRGRTLAISRSELRNADGKILALATGSALIVNRPWRDFAALETLAALEEGD